MNKRAALTKTVGKKGKEFGPLKSKGNLSLSIDSPVDQIFCLQRTIGNQEVQRLLKSGKIQARLKNGKPNDKYEQEADLAADKVMSMPEPKGELQVPCRAIGASGGKMRLSSLYPDLNVQGKFADLPLGDGGVVPAQRVVQMEGLEKQYRSTKRWKYFDESSLLRDPTAAELKNNTFLELNPKDIAKKVGMPNPFHTGIIGFLIIKTGKYPEDRTVLGAWYQKNFRKMVVGPEVDKLYDWLNNQRIVAGMIRGVDTTLTGLQTNGILDADFNLKNEAQLKTMLGRLAEAGRTEEYASKSKDRSQALLRVTGKVTQRDVELKKQLIEVRKYGTEVMSLHEGVRIAKNDLETFYRDKEVKASATELAKIKTEKAKVVKWTGAVLDVAASGLGIWKGVKDARTDASDEGSITASASGVGVVKAISGLVIDAIYADQIKNAKSALKIAKIRAAASKETGLVMKIDALISRLDSYSALCRKLKGLTKSYIQMKQVAAGEFGTVAAEALGEMRDTSKVSTRDPYGARKRVSKGNIQRVFANVLEYEAISSLLKGSTWPELEGEIPLSGWLRTNRLLKRDILKPMVKEAAKLRWWKKRMGNIDKLLSLIKTTIVAIGEKTKSRG